MTGILNFFGNSTPNGDGERPLSEIHADPATNGTITVTLPGDLRGQWLNATWTRVNLDDFAPAAVTSELSNAIFGGAGWLRPTKRR